MELAGKVALPVTIKLATVVVERVVLPATWKLPEVEAFTREV